MRAACRARELTGGARLPGGAGVQLEFASLETDRSTLLQLHGFTHMPGTDTDPVHADSKFLTAELRGGGSGEPPQVRWLRRTAGAALHSATELQRFRPAPSPLRTGFGAVVLELRSFGGGAARFAVAASCSGGAARGCMDAEASNYDPAAAVCRGALITSIPALPSVHHLSH
eukprot:SAG11_NODE_4106_length_2062_cov_4.083036_3_plen_172_part_00